ncbi:MAG: hypothetical protein LBG74_08125 [Spirochaetaceae bacterium]|nr:hypothetical protein [Spirochaetaceae bacterium]
MLCLFLCTGCEKRTLVLWTDIPEFVLYVQLFNTAQNTYKIEAREIRGLAQELIFASRDKKNRVDIAAGKWLKTAALASFWQKTDFVFDKKNITKKMFYAPLLNFGQNGREQILLPLSFNLGALVSLTHNSRAESESGEESQIFITLDEIRKRGTAFNRNVKGAYTRMGFSPTWNWNGDFLYAAAELSGAAFREEAPFAWDETALESVIGEFRTWLNKENGGAAAEDDFIFKYSYEPVERLVDRERILFTYMKSNSFFALPAEELNRLDYRWLWDASGGSKKIPVLEDIVMLGITKRCAAKGAAAAFLRWLYAEGTQKDLLTKGKGVYINETSFGICGGFSAVRSVTESVFPQAYPAFLSHIPPEDYLLAPNPLPANWPEIKERIVVPYIRERVKNTGEADVRDLRPRLADWLRINNRGLQFHQQR